MHWRVERGAPSVIALDLTGVARVLMSGADRGVRNGS
jgi:hypothetical protein